MKTQEKKPLKYIASCSFGKDSISTVLLALEHGEPLDDICYVEVMYDNARGISAEHPEHRQFIYDIAIPYFEKRGIHTTIVRPEYDYIHEFYRKRLSGPYQGKYNGFPLAGLCLINKNCKIRAINAYNKAVKKSGFSPIHYVGIAADEPKRLARLAGKTDISLLQKYGVSEEKAVDICKAAGLYSPLYQFSKRGGGVGFAPMRRGRTPPGLGTQARMAT